MQLAPDNIQIWSQTNTGITTYYSDFYRNGEAQAELWFEGTLAIDSKRLSIWILSSTRNLHGLNIIKENGAVGARHDGHQLCNKNWEPRYHMAVLTGWT